MCNKMGAVIIKMAESYDRLQKRKFISAEVSINSCVFNVSIYNDHVMVNDTWRVFCNWQKNNYSIRSVFSMNIQPLTTYEWILAKKLAPEQLAFCMVTHPKLGKESIFQHLTTDVIRVIFAELLSILSKGKHKIVRKCKYNQVRFHFLCAEWNED